MDIYCERMLKIWCGSIKIRLWIHDTGQTETFFEAIRKNARKFIDEHHTSGSYDSIKECAENLIGYASVNAVEVIDYYDNGVVLYKDWP